MAGPSDPSWKPNPGLPKLRLTVGLGAGVGDANFIGGSKPPKPSALDRVAGALHECNPRIGHFNEDCPKPEEDPPPQSNSSSDNGDGFSLADLLPEHLGVTATLSLNLWDADGGQVYTAAGIDLRRLDEKDDGSFSPVRQTILGALAVPIMVGIRTDRSVFNGFAIGAGPAIVWRELGRSDENVSTVGWMATADIGIARLYQGKEISIDILANLAAHFFPGEAYQGGESSGGTVGTAMVFTCIGLNLLDQTPPEPDAEDRPPVRGDLPKGLLSMPAADRPLPRMEPPPPPPAPPPPRETILPLPSVGSATGAAERGGKGGAERPASSRGPRAAPTRPRVVPPPPQLLRSDYVAGEVLALEHIHFKTAEPTEEQMKWLKGVVEKFVAEGRLREKRFFAPEELQKLVGGRIFEAPMLATKQLVRMSQLLNHQKVEKYRFQVIGHTDSRSGPDKPSDYNEELSKRRAECVTFMLTLLGVSPIRLETSRGMAYQEPAYAEEDLPPGEVGHAQMLNRRIAVIISGRLDQTAP